MPGPFERNEHGLWCPSCGELLLAPWSDPDNFDEENGECRACGFPDDAEQMAQYHCGDEEE